VRRVIGGAFTVPIALGAGVSEKAHENALAHERREAGLTAKQQQGPTITYDGVVVGEDAADPIAGRVLLVELQFVNALSEAHHAQRIDYPKAFGLSPDSKLNFGTKRLEIERMANTG
jgi:GxxExxY protein